MADESNKGEAPPASAGWLRTETFLAVAAALVAASFVLPWFETSAGDDRLSGLDFALRGGLWSGLFAIPTLAAITIGLGLLRWRAARFAGLATAIAMLIAALLVLAPQWPWLYTIPLVAGLVMVGLGVAKRGLQFSWMLGVALLGAAAVATFLYKDEQLLPSEGDGGVFGLPLAAAVPLILLAVSTVLSGLALIVGGIRKKGRERALLLAGKSVVGFAVYMAALERFGAVVATSGIGIWLLLFGGVVLLLLSRPLASRASKPAPAKAERKSKPDKKAKTDKAAKADKAAKGEPAAAAKAEPAAVKAEPAPGSDKTDDADKAARLEKLRKLKKLKELEEQEKAAAREAKAAEKQEKATAKAAEALLNEPEPVFAVDPSKPPPPADEDRDALMQRVGVKKPPPPSESELEDMLAALKNRAGDD